MLTLSLGSLGALGAGALLTCGGVDSAPGDSSTGSPVFHVAPRTIRHGSGTDLIV